MKAFSWLSAFSIGLLFCLLPAQAARDGQTQPSPTPQMELVVLEVEGCVYCGVFRRRHLENYKASRQGKKIPIRFVDINDPALGNIGLTQPVGIVPTFIVLKNNEEIGRIPGLVSHHDFYRAIEHITKGVDGF
ncbi:MAG: thioredoxin family protein [Filomicrobium sp.]